MCIFAENIHVMEMIFRAIILRETEPQSTNVIWCRPVEGGFAFYIYRNGAWKVMKLMNDAGTFSPDDDTVADISNIPEIVEEEVEKQIGKIQPLGPSSVGTEEIIDDSVMLEDLNTEVKEKISDTYSQNDESLDLGGLTL